MKTDDKKKGVKLKFCAKGGDETCLFTTSSVETYLRKALEKLSMKDSQPTD